MTYDEVEQRKIEAAISVDDPQRGIERGGDEHQPIADSGARRRSEPDRHRGAPRAGAREWMRRIEGDGRERRQDLVDESIGGKCLRGERHRSHGALRVRDAWPMSTLRAKHRMREIRLL